MQCGFGLFRQSGLPECGDDVGAMSGFDVFGIGICFGSSVQIVFGRDGELHQLFECDAVQVLFSGV